MSGLQFPESASDNSDLGGTGDSPVPAGDSPAGTGATVRAAQGGLFATLTSNIPVGKLPTGAGESPAPPIFQTRFEKPSHGCRKPLNALAAVAGIAAAAGAFAASPRLASITPTGGQRGVELEVRFNGERLDDAEEIISYEPGLNIINLESVTNKLVVARVKIAADCVLGEHHLRVRAASGLSELRTFFVGPYPVVAEVEPNNDPAHAQKIDYNTTVSGVIKNEDVDCFSVEARKGQRLSVEVEGMRLGRGVFDPRLAVLDETGAVIADVDDTWLALQDPFVSLVAPHDGHFVIQLREVTYGGSDDCDYRLHVGAFPRPTSIYPLGGRMGDTLPVTFFSDATGAFTNAVPLPRSTHDKYPVFAELDGLSAPTPNWIRVSPFPNVLAAPPNEDREHATTARIQPPLALNGILSRKGQEGWFRFPAAKGVALEVNVYARQLRSPLDSIIEVFDRDGRSLAANDDSVGVDSALKFTPSETTNYFLRIRDTLGGGGRDFTYRVEITPAVPRVSVKIPEVARNDSQARQWIAVPRGNRFATLISAKRANFSGELQFHVDGLPQGMTMTADALPQNLDSIPLVFEASADAPIGGKLLDLTASGINGSSRASGKFRQDVILVEGPNNSTYYSTSVDKLCVAVTREAPFKLRIAEPQVPIVQAGSMRLEVDAERDPGFDEPIELQMVWNPPGVSSQSDATIPKDATNVFYTLNAGGGADLRSWKIAVLGQAKVKEGEVYVSSQLAPLRVAAPYLAGKIETTWVTPGKPAKITVTLQQQKSFAGKAVIRLGGLPEKITAADREITAEDKEVVFDLNVDPKCPSGPSKNLFCAVDVMQSGQVIPHTIAAGGILRVVPPKKEPAKIAAVDGRK
jgi:hypothetical protein